MNQKTLRCAAMVCACAAVLAGAGGPAFGQQSTMPGVPHPQASQAAPDLGAHGRYSKAPINLNQPNLALATALVDAGGGAAAFDANKLLGALTGNGPLTETERAALVRKFGAANVASFVKTFDFATADALTRIAKDGAVLPAQPAADPNDAKALATALYDAGITPRGKFDVEYMLDTLVSHIVHVAMMNDIDADPDLGPNADANYHLVLGQIMLDLTKSYSLAPPPPAAKG